MREESSFRIHTAVMREIWTSCKTCRLVCSLNVTAARLVVNEVRAWLHKNPKDQDCALEHRSVILSRNAFQNKIPLRKFVS